MFISGRLTRMLWVVNPVFKVLAFLLNLGGVYVLFGPLGVAIFFGVVAVVAGPFLLFRDFNREERRFEVDVQPAQRASSVLSRARSLRR